MPRKPPKKVRPNLKRRPRHFLRAWREHRNKTQDQVASALGVSSEQVGRVENGQRKYLQPYLEALAEYLETDPGSLLMRDPRDPEAIWSVWDKVEPADRAVAIEQLKAFTKRRTG